MTDNPMDKTPGDASSHQERFRQAKLDPPQTPPVPAAPPVQEQVDDYLADYQSMDKGVGIPTVFESLLKHPARIIFEISRERRAAAVAALVFIVVICFLGYGFITGLFAGGQQLWHAPLKVTGGALLSALICFPSLYIFSCLCGADTTPGEMMGLLLGALGLTAILLIGFAPVAWVFTVSTDSPGFMGFLHLTFWGIGTFFGMRFLARGFRLFNGSRRGYLTIWMVIFTLVTLQMTTALRPIIGTSETVLPTEKKFFLIHWGDVLAGDDQPPTATRSVVSGEPGD